MSEKQLPILVTAIGGGGHGEQILKALKLVDHDRYFIVGADAQAHCSQAALVDEFVTLPLASHPDYLTELLSICGHYKIKVLFHGCEPELKLFSAERKHIEKAGILLPINSENLISVCMNKEATNTLLTEFGFGVPYCVRVKKKSDIKMIDWYPVVVKPSIGSGGSANVYIAQNKTELYALADYLGLENITDNFIIQEYVGTQEDEYTVGVLHDLAGNYLNSIAVKRLMSGQLNVRTSIPNRTDRTDLGSTLVISSGVSHGYVGRFPHVTQQCKEIAKAIDVKGPINIQCRLVNGQIKVFEINPRFSGTTSLRAMVGYNEPDVLIRRHIFGETIEEDFPYNEALILRGLTEYEVTV